MECYQWHNFGDIAWDCRNGMKWSPKKIKEKKLFEKSIKVWIRKQVELRIELALSAPNSCSSCWLVMCLEHNLWSLNLYKLRFCLCRLKDLYVVTKSKITFLLEGWKWWKKGQKKSMLLITTHPMMNPCSLFPLFCSWHQCVSLMFIYL